MINKKILFVCMGNICRSPLAHAVFQEMVDNNGFSEYFEIESAGTGGWDVGQLADKRMRSEAKKHGIAMNHFARQLKCTDLDYYDLILPMDLNNMQYIFTNFGYKNAKKIRLFREFDYKSDSENSEVPDPYYGGEESFSNVYKIVFRTCEELLLQLTK